ncbi:MAG: biotin-dependent carboxyltransferase family protein [Planctomycetota bacterium]
MLQIIQPGSLTTVQDRGRLGYQRYGVPVSGPMDRFAFGIANLLAGNHQDAACLEVTLFGPELKVLEDSVIAVTGADFPVTLDGQPMPMWQSLKVNHRGSVISFGVAGTGCRAYLAIRGGIKNIPRILGSQSTYTRKGALGQGEIKPLGTDDIIEAGIPVERAGYQQRILSAEFIPRYPDEITLRVIMGPQNDYFTPEGIKTFLASEYKVTTNSDRMGYRLEGPPIEHSESGEIISDGVPLGAVQVPGDRMPIILMADRQTTGGYPKIATVITVDTYKLAQARPDNRVRFSAVSIQEAISELRKVENIFQLIHRSSR